MYSQLLTTPTVAQYAQPVVSETSYLHLTLSSNYKPISIADTNFFWWFLPSTWSASA